VSLGTLVKRSIGDIISGQERHLTDDFGKVYQNAKYQDSDAVFSDNKISCSQYIGCRPTDDTAKFNGHSEHRSFHVEFLISKESSR
jgi:hypothetical protein